MKKALFLLVTMSLVVAPASFAEDIADIDIADVTADLTFLAGFGLPTDINGKRGADIGEVTCFKSTFSGNAAMNAAYVANKTLALADIGPVVRDTFGADEAATVVAVFMCLGDVAETTAFMTDPDVAALGATWTQAASYDTSQAGLDTGQVGACNGVGGGEGEGEGPAEGEGEGSTEGEDPPVITTTGGGTYEVGDRLELSLQGAEGAASFQWRKNGSDLSGRTSSSLVIDPLVFTDAGTYDCEIDTGSKAIVFSSPVVVVVVSALPVAGGFGLAVLAGAIALAATLRRRR